MCQNKQPMVETGPYVDLSGKLPKRGLGGVWKSERGQTYDA